MYMVRNSVYNNGFLSFWGYDARNVFKYIFSPGLMKKVFSSFYSENILDVDLVKGARHSGLLKNWCFNLNKKLYNFTLSGFFWSWSILFLQSFHRFGVLLEKQISFLFKNFLFYIFPHFNFYLSIFYSINPFFDFIFLPFGDRLVLNVNGKKIEVFY